MGEVLAALGVAHTCVTVLSTVASLSIQITSFVSQVRDARRDMDTVSRELSSLSSCLQMLHDDCAGGQVNYPQKLQQSLVEVLRNCEGVLEEMQELLKKLASGNIGRRVQWSLTGRDDMMKLKSTLEAHKATIDIALNMVEM